jgi:rfaE bifunctional protein kinase chain/domain
MDEQRLQTILARFPSITVLVVGDFFLDKYLVIDRRLSEVSLETGLEAYQVVEVRPSPGAAGTVTSNLRALAVDVIALGMIGDDGEGYELKRGLISRGVDAAPLFKCRDRFTPTYTKPMIRELDGFTHELNRLDIKNRTPLPAEIEDAIITRLHQVAPRVHGVIIVDQVQERNCGVVTDRVRDEIAALARAHPEVVFAAESRERIGLFREVIVQSNRRETLRAIHPGREDEVDRAQAEVCAAELYRRTGWPVFITLGAAGILLYDSEGCRHIPTMAVSGPIDTVGAGDSVMAGIVSSLCSGAAPAEAAVVGNLVASVTIQQIGITGTASREQVLERFGEFMRFSSPTP